MASLTLRPIPPIMLHLRRGDSNPGPIAWAYGYHRTDDGVDRCWPQVRSRKWRPSYWLLWLRVWWNGSAGIGHVDPFTGAEYEAYFGDHPNFRTREAMEAWVRHVNRPFERA